MLNKLRFCVLLLLLCSSTVIAQTSSTGEFQKFEIFGGFSHNQIDVYSDDFDDNGGFFENRLDHNGFEVSGVVNVHRYVGIKGDFAAHYKKYTVSFPAFGTTPAQSFRLKSSIYNFLGGVQVKNNAKEGSRFRPFAHALVGVAHSRGGLEGSNETGTTNGLAAAFGGGLDIKANEHLTIRAVQVDYNPTRLADATQQNFRIGIGLVFH